MNKTNFKQLSQMFSKMNELEKKYNLNLISDLDISSHNYYFNTPSKFKMEYFKFCLHLFEFDKPLKIINNKSYNKLSGLTYGDKKPIEIKELFRGARNISHHLNLIKDNNYHPGIGDYFYGLYTATSFETAKRYAENNDENVLHLKTQNMTVADNLFFDIILSNLDKDLSCMNVPENKIECFQEFVSTLSEQDKIKFFKLLYDNISIFAMYLGVDCIFDQNFPSFVLLNRGKIVISQKEADRIAESSQFQLQ